VKYLIVNDEHALYRRMFADLYQKNAFDVEEIPRVQVPTLLRPIYRFHFSDPINRRIRLPLKKLWEPFYGLYRYPFRAEEKYCVVFLNGSLRYHFDAQSLLAFKKSHPNVAFALLLYDSFSNPAAKRSIGMIPVFDCVLSSDEGDCKAHGLHRFYATFSRPDFVFRNAFDQSAAFFAGYGSGRLRTLQETFAMITGAVPGCRFYIAGVDPQDQLAIPGVMYNQVIPYEQELQLAYNTSCIVEVVKEGQNGVTLRTCEAIAFHKKLLTNNASIRNTPFYDERFIRVFTSADEIDTSFLLDDLAVQYEASDFFGPSRIIEQLDAILNERTATL
jgi:hypothetical protein